MRVRLVLTVLAAAISAAAVANDGKIDYDHQEQWHGALDKAQSPIDIVTGSAVEADGKEQETLTIARTVAPVSKVEDNGHGVQVDTNATEATIRGRHFTLAQFHFHATSEHTIDGKHYPLEGHFVFKAQDGRLAVIGVMFDEGAANAAAQTIVDDLAPGAKLPAQQTIDIAALMPKRLAYYHYLGSLTTPPLTENVEWYVLPTPVTMSKAQIDAFLSHYRHNNRNVQPLNGRPVVHYGG